MRHILFSIVLNIYLHGYTQLEVLFISQLSTYQQQCHFHSITHNSFQNPKSLQISIHLITPLTINPI